MKSSVSPASRVAPRGHRADKLILFVSTIHISIRHSQVGVNVITSLNVLQLRITISTEIDALTMNSE